MIEGAYVQYQSVRAAEDMFSEMVHLDRLSLFILCPYRLNMDKV